MGRSTKGKVNITNVNTNNIKEITDSDKPFIKQRSRKASEFFKDLTESGNEIYNNFIDETYCPADEGETKKDKLTRAPYRWSQWRNYGGAEVNVNETIPEIFWANIIDAASGSDAERAPQTQEEFDTMKELNAIPELVLYPSEADIINQIDNSAINSRHLASSYQSTMFTGTRILNSKVATKIGIDYFGNTSPSIPEFEIKVTPYITDGISKIKYYRTVDVEGVITQEEKDTLLHIGGGLFLAIFGAKTIAELGPALVAWFNSLIGPFTPCGVIIKSLNQLWGKIWAWFLSLTEMPALATIASVLEPIALFIGLILVADVIWDVFNPSAEILDMAYQYSNAVAGTYIFEDIALSKYSYGFGRKYQQHEGKETKLITQDGESKGYTLNSFNSGTTWSENNLFTKFPNQASGSPDKYLNWDFNPKSYQYDLDTPPPTIEYLVELVPIRNCKLSIDKPTAFVVRVVPDKFLAPKFEAITSVVGAKGKELYKNTSITFKNARYCDFIFLEDTTKHEPDDYSNLWGLLGDLFTQYYHVAVNTDSNQNLGSGNRFFSFDGRDLTANGLILMGALTKYETYGTQRIGYATPYSDKYIVNFMQEASPSIIYNQYFRTEYNSDISSKLTGLRQFWKTNEFVTISGGAATCSGGVGLLYQHIPTIGVGYYVLTLECSGDVYLKTGGSGSCFEYGVYSWNGDSGRYKTSNQEMISGWTDKGIPIPDCSVVTLVDELERIQFSSGFYKIIVKAKSTGTKDISFAMTDGSSISTCKLQKLPNSKASESAKRGCYNAIVTENQQSQWFNWKNEYLSTKTFSFYYDWAYNHEYNIQITIPDRTGITNVAVKWNKINTTSETINYPFEIGVPINISYQGDNVPMFKADVTLSYGTTTYSLTKTLTVTNNDEFLLDVYDSFGALEESILDLSHTKIGSTYQQTKNWNFKKHKYRLKELNISNTQSSDSVENITSITNSINISNTDVGGFFSQLSSIPRVICENTNISKYGTGQSYYAIGTKPYIVWKNSKTQIEESSLNLLLNTLAKSNTYNGYLDITGDNPEITNELALANIDILVGRNWNVLYNEVTIPVITLLGNNPLILNLGETFVDPGATALDGKDGDITSSIVTTSTVDINTEGIYQVSYNVTDSDGNVAEEVIRVIEVEEGIDWTYEGVMTVGERTTEGLEIGWGNYGGEVADFGSLIPDLPVSYYEATIIWGTPNYYAESVTGLFIYVGDDFPFTTDDIILNIDGDSYILAYSQTLGGGDYVYFFETSTNPFPPVGQTCEIKLKYTLAPEPEPTFPEVTIGTQTWMAVNLDVDDGLGGIYAYNNDENNVAIYGRLYTWDAAVRVAASIDGWHLPSDAEWTTLTTYLGGESVAGGKLKEAGTTHWNSPNTGATNETGFTALPGGYREYRGTFKRIGLNGYWWSATEYDNNNAWYRRMYYDNSNVIRNMNNKMVGSSVRLVRD